MQQLKIGDIVAGQIESERDWGFLFRSSGGTAARLPRNELTWVRSRIKGIIFPEIGATVLVKVLDVKPKKDVPGEYITVSVRALLPNPWDSVQLIYPIGTRVQARVAAFAEAGAVIDLRAGLSLLIHHTQVSWRDPNARAEDELELDELIEVIVTESSKAPNLLLGSYRDAMEDPWPQFAKETLVGTKSFGMISGLTEYGAFVKLEDGFVGLMHKSQNPEFVKLQMGEKVTVTILSIDPANHRLSLAPARAT